MNLFFLFYSTCVFANIDLANNSLIDEWTSFKKDFGKSYATAEEHTRRLDIFRINLEVIAKHNRQYELGRESYQMGITPFVDLLPEEFMNLVARFTHIITPTPPSPRYDTGKNGGNSSSQLPKSKDWRKEGAVTPVKDQGQCGSCYAFAACAVLEGFQKITHNELKNCSEQNLLDCTYKKNNADYPNEGCNGGYMNETYQYVKDNAGLNIQPSYLYEGKEGPCRFDRNKPIMGNITEYGTIEQGNEKALQKVVAEVGPVSCGVRVTPMFQMYKKGIFMDPFCNPYMLNHAVANIGYGSNNGRDYWIVKNSWSTSWGEGGYMKLARNANNMCGIASMANSVS